MVPEVVGAFVNVFTSQGVSAAAELDWSKVPKENRESIERYCERKRASTSRRIRVQKNPLFRNLVDKISSIL